MSVIPSQLALELGANLLNLASILLAGRNHVATWPLGILGCIAFGFLFFRTQLYADATLQLFFIATSLWGWRQWSAMGETPPLAVKRTPKPTLALALLASVLVTAVYGVLLHHFTNAYAPYADSVVLAFSVTAQLLLMRRRLETWWFWIIVNSVAVPLYFSRDLTLTAWLYVGFWGNAVISYFHWRKLATAEFARAEKSQP
ncbi:MAG TPA: nicotinamide riboside transporter PnuC [Opitutaceae bacterium]|nr:nicotinamide riboside transporter PnuC [Opitutaceae bacterium]